MITRSLVFYRWADVPGRRPFDLEDCSTRLAEELKGDAHFAVLEGNGVTTAVTLMNQANEKNVLKLRLLALRSTGDRPLQWEPGGDLSSLDLDDDQYPADVSYVAIWPDGYAAQDMHSNSPRLGRLSYFLQKKMSTGISFEPLYQPDMFERLKDLAGQIRGVEFSMTRPEYLDQSKGVFGVLIPAIWGEKVPSLQMKLSMGRYGPRDRYLEKSTEDTILKIAEDANEIVDKLIVRGRNKNTGKVEEVNLLSQRLQSSRPFDPDAHAPTYPDPSSVFLAFEHTKKDFEADNILQRATQAKVRPGGK